MTDRVSLLKYRIRNPHPEFEEQEYDCNFSLKEKRRLTCFMRGPRIKDDTAYSDPSKWKIEKNVVFAKTEFMNGEHLVAFYWLPLFSIITFDEYCDLLKNFGYVLDSGGTPMHDSQRLLYITKIDFGYRFYDEMFKRINDAFCDYERGESSPQEIRLSDLNWQKGEAQISQGYAADGYHRVNVWFCPKHLLTHRTVTDKKTGKQTKYWRFKK